MDSMVIKLLLINTFCHTDLLCDHRTSIASTTTLVEEKKRAKFKSKMAELES